jgi:hypothetical protein
MLCDVDAARAYIAGRKHWFTDDATGLLCLIHANSPSRV